MATDYYLLGVATPIALAVFAAAAWLLVNERSGWTWTHDGVNELGEEVRHVHRHRWWLPRRVTRWWWLRRCPYVRRLRDTRFDEHLGQVRQRLLHRKAQEMGIDPSRFFWCGICGRLLVTDSLKPDGYDDIEYEHRMRGQCLTRNPSSGGARNTGTSTGRADHTPGQTVVRAPTRGTPIPPPPPGKSTP